MNLDWRALSFGYLFAILENRRWLDGTSNHLHPDAVLPYDFIQQFIQSYRAFPTVNHIKERFNIDWRHFYLQGFTLEEISSRIKNESSRFAVQQTVNELQKILTSGQAAQGIGAYLKPIIDLQNSLYSASEGKVFRLSEWREAYNYYASGDQARKVCEYGFPTIDDITGGITPNQLIILYANTTQGKSTLARAIAGNIAMQGKRVLYFTLEESGRKSVIKSLATQARVNANAIIENTLSIDAYKKLTEFGNIPGDIILVDRTEQKSTAEIHRYVHQYEPDIIIVDQIPLMTKGGSMNVDDVTQVSRKLKDFTQQTALPIIALTQATRKAISSKKPSMEETMGFAYAMCQDGDVVMFLWPDEEGPGYTRKRISFLKVRDRKKDQQVDLRWDLANGIIEEEALYLQSFQRPKPGGTNEVQPKSNNIVPGFANSQFAQSV